MYTFWRQVIHKSAVCSNVGLRVIRDWWVTKVKGHPHWAGTITMLVSVQVISCCKKKRLFSLKTREF